MSNYCGKCDFADHLEIFGLDRPMKVFIRNEEVDCSTEKNRALYYPYIIGFSVGDHNGQVLHLTHVSYIRLQELETLEMIRAQLITAYNRCKRKKIPFSLENATEKMWSHYTEGPYLDATVEIYNRVKNYVKNAKVDDLHINSSINDYYRGAWLNELIRLGWDKEFAIDWVMNH